MPDQKMLQTNVTDLQELYFPRADLSLQNTGNVGSIPPRVCLHVFFLCVDDGNHAVVLPLMQGILSLS